MVTRWLPHLQTASLYAAVYEGRRRRAVKVARGSSSHIPVSFYPGTKVFPRSPSTWHLFGQKGVSWPLWATKVARKGSRFFSIYIRKWARRKDEESPTKEFIATNKLLFFLSLLLRLQTAVSANSLPHSWKWTLTNLPPRQLTLPIEHGRMGFRTLLHYFWKVISSCTWVDGTGPFKSLWNLPVQAEELRGKVVLALIRFS